MLLEDQGIWSDGTGYEVSIVIVVKITRPSAAGAVSAERSVTMFDQNGTARVFNEVLSSSCSQNHSNPAKLLVPILIPRPQNPLRQIPITHSQLYRGMLSQGVLAYGLIGLDLDALRDTLEFVIRSEGFSIAP